ncbi:unnamed protein product [Gemmataceae bacterium]|nr:unnamed protein product [Gemmataceae bacterium]VTT98954.1 unnamed protein product [Gemmataceae bacterium]
MCLSIALAFAPRGRAGDPTPEATARAALALAKSKAAPAVATAPAPRPAVLDYRTAKRISLERHLPVVVFVGCEPVPSRDGRYLTAYADALADYKPGTALVCYPSGEELWNDAQISCPAPPAEIERAVKTAGKKVEARPAGRKLDWS